MNTDRLMLKGRKAELDAKACGLVLKVNANAEAVRALLTMAGIESPDKLKLKEALSNLKEALNQQQELATVRNELAQIEERLA